jgi:D-alanyl-D-alanine carboxypeptidase
MKQGAARLRPAFRDVLRSIRLAPFALAALLAFSSGAQGQRAPIDEHVVDSIVNTAMQKQHLVGLSVVLMRGGRMELVKSYGLASVQPRVPVDTGTRFAIGSVTKQFVAALALLLQEDGRLNVHDTLSKWYPRLTRSSEVTLLDLMNHVSGYRDYYPLDYVDREMAQATTAEHILGEYATKRLDFDPGTRWSYSNTGYTILGRVLERAGGKPLGTLLEERIFRPLGLRQTEFAQVQPKERRADGYVSWALGDMELAQLEGAGWTGAAGAIWSTASDLARWDLALMHPGFLSPESRKILFGERVLRDGTPTGYAAGLSVSQSGGRTIYEHGGATSGFSAMNVFVPEDTAAVTILSNTDQNVGAEPLVRLVSPPHPDAPAAPARKRQKAMKAPEVAGAAPLALSAAFFGALQHGTVDRKMLSDDYNAFLTPARLAAASRTLAPLGDITNAELLGVSERGGMQVSVVRLTAGGRVITTLMYRDPNGVLEEYLLW